MEVRDTCHLCGNKLVQERKFYYDHTYHGWLYCENCLFECEFEEGFD